MAQNPENPTGFTNKDLSRIFRELKPEALKTLYRYSEVRNLKTGDFLLREGDTGQNFYVILNGELEVFKNANGRPREIARLGSGDWVGEISFIQKIPTTASITAATPSSVMAVGEATLNALDDAAQVFFLKKLNELANSRIQELASLERELKEQNTQLLDRIYVERHHKEIEYSKSRMVLGIIQKVPRLPSFASSLLVRMAQPNTSLQKVAALIQQDPSSVAVVLKAVNSPYFGLRQKISSVNHALALLGTSRIYQLVVAEGLKRVMPSSQHFARIHAHSVAVSHIAFAISLASRAANPSEASTIGLLHDLGRSLILLLKRQNASMAVLLDSLDHAQLAALLLKEWGMSDVLVETVRYQSHPQFFPPERIQKEIRNTVALLYLAHLCLEELEKTSHPKATNMFLAEYLALFHWEKLGIKHLVLKHLLPIMAKGINGYPIELRKLLREHAASKNYNLSGGKPGGAG